MGDKALVRKHVYVTGRVQGVGFRCQAFYLARSLGLTGTVANLCDGRVEMEVQGEEAMVRQLLSSLDGKGWIRIDYMDVRDIPLKERERAFQVLN